MSRKWLRILWLVGLCACGPTCVARVSADPQPNSDRGIRPAPATTAAQLERISQSIETLKQQARANHLDAEVKADKILNEIARLDQQLASVYHELNAAQAPASPLNTISGYGPTPSGTITTGRIQLVNEFDSQKTIVVNGISYRLAPHDVRTIPVQAGTFTYEVLDAPDRPIQERTVAPAGVFTIRVFPIGI